ncbi:ESX secretion-associated protein EspG [Rhodococcus pyridinivorans]|uniref:ESX secretion-associated protein EspG n=1 Tax=Rhodococcus pyridinivorans TaxID=103816 RepID=UPI00265B01B3|nr:ESX secretion-associated protein EspG [Rhodococcus pyridinivorans]
MAGDIGPNITEIPDELEKVVAAQLISSGLVTDAHTLSADARTLLDPLFSYDSAYSAVLLLHNQRQPVSIEIDEQWAEYVADSVRAASTPRVYILVAASGATVTTALRAGDHIDVTQSTATDTFENTAAQNLLALADPEKSWSPAQISAVSFPAHLLDRAPLRPPTPGRSNAQAEADHKETVFRFISALRDSGVSSRTVAAVEKLLRLDHIAAMHVAYISGPHRMLSEGSASIDYFHEAGVAVGGLQLAADGRKWKTLAPATQSEVATALRELKRLPSRPMHHALNTL